MLIRLGQLGRDKDGGQITEISPAGDLVVTVPLLHWRDSALIGVTDFGLAVFRRGAGIYLMGTEGRTCRSSGLRDPRRRRGTCRNPRRHRARS